MLVYNLKLKNRSFNFDKSSSLLQRAHLLQQRRGEEEEKKRRAQLTMLDMHVNWF